jgi:HPr kinase/phosphorylase
VAPGRSLAILVEVAARNQLLRNRGRHAARELVARHEEALRGAAPVPSGVEGPPELEPEVDEDYE